jgi:hypothetical protein
MDINQLGPMEEDFVASTVCAVLCDLLLILISVFLHVDIWRFLAITFSQGERNNVHAACDRKQRLEWRRQGHMKRVCQPRPD